MTSEDHYYTPGLTNKQRSDPCPELSSALSAFRLLPATLPFLLILQGRVQPALGADLRLTAMNNAAAPLSRQKLLGSP